MVNIYALYCRVPHASISGECVRKCGIGEKEAEKQLVSLRGA